MVPNSGSKLVPGACPVRGCAAPVGVDVSKRGTELTAATLDSGTTAAHHKAAGKWPRLLSPRASSGVGMASSPPERRPHVVQAIEPPRVLADTSRSALVEHDPCTYGGWVSGATPLTSILRPAGVDQHTTL